MAEIEIFLERVPFESLELGENARQRLASGEYAGIPELAQMIEATKWVAPLQVARLPGGRYRVVAGNRRYAAVKLLRERWGCPGLWDSVPVEILPHDANGAIINVAENVGRVDLTVRDQSEHYHALHRAGMSVAEIARGLGVSKETVQRVYALKVRLQPEVWAALGRGLDVPKWELCEWAEQSRESQLRALAAYTGKFGADGARKRRPAGFIGARRASRLVARLREGGHDTVPLDLVEFILGKRKVPPHGYAHYDAREGSGTEGDDAGEG